MSDKHLPFDEHFQSFYISHLLQDNSFLQRVKRDLTPDLFSSDLAQRVVRLTLSFVEEYNAPPSELIYTELDRLAAKIGMTDLTPIKTYLAKLFGLPLQNREYLLKTHDSFFRHQRLLSSIPKLVNLAKNGELDEAEQIVKDLVTYRPSRNLSPGVRMSRDPQERIDRRLADDQERFLMLIPELDRVIGGLGRGELGVFHSQRSSIGKTTALVHVAKSAVFQGYKVLIYTLEESAENYQDRIDQCVAGLLKRELTDYEKLSSAMNSWFWQNGDIIIKQLPQGSTSVEDLRAHKQMLENTEGFNADLVIIDQAEELVPDDKTIRSDFLYGAGKNIYSATRGWAVEDQIGIWTGMHATRGAAEKTVADQEDAGGSIAKVQIADIILSINRTPKEAEEGLTRVFISKNRHGGGDRFAISVRSDMHRQQFYKHSV